MGVKCEELGTGVVWIFRLPDRRSKKEIIGEHYIMTHFITSPKIVREIKARRMR
jgi:hypothetical protein